MPIRGDRVKERRRKFGLSQEELAEAVGVNQGQISDYEQSKGNPTATSLEGLAKSLGTSIDYILGLTDDPTPIDDNDPGILKPKERLVIEKWRDGDLTAAVKIILNG